MTQHLMKVVSTTMIVIALIGLPVCLTIAAARSSMPHARAGSAALKLVQTIPLAGVEGRIDHMAVDLKGNRLFVAALGNNTLEVIDIKAGRVIHSVKGLREPQGVGYMPALDRIYVANGQGEGVDVFDGASYRRLSSVRLGEDADNVRIDPAKAEIVVGYGKGALAFMYANGDQPSVRRRVKLWGHPESFQIDRARGLVYVNVPSAKAIEVCDRSSEKSVALWPVSDGSANFPMALDAEQNLLVVACREPARLCFFDTKAGRLTSSMPTVGDADDLFFDSALNRLHVVGGEGAVDVFERTVGTSFRKLPSVATAPGARTGFFVPALRRLYVAVPHRGSQSAEIRVFEAVH